MRNNPALPIGFLSMSQSSHLSGDLLVVHKKRGSDGCAGVSVGASAYGCADADSGVAFGGWAHNCRRDCNKLTERFTRGDGPTCEHVHLADAVFYEDRAYEAQPTDSRARGLIDKILMEEILTEDELHELEPLRMPSADIDMTPSAEETTGPS